MKEDVILEETDISSTESSTKVTSSYTSDNIKVLEGLEAVRLRPGMYIGTTSVKGLHHLVWEIVDNGIDEALAGHCNEIVITLNNDGSVTVKDNGRGIPTGIVKGSNLSGVETAYTKLHAGGKFGEGGGYKVAGGLHGVGASVVNALSEYCEVTVERDGKKHFVRFENGGHILEHLKVIGDSDNHGTTVRFKPDATIFAETQVFDYDTIKDRMRVSAYLNRGITIIIKDEREGSEQEDKFYYEGGIKDFVAFINQNRKPINKLDKKDTIECPIFYCEGREKIKTAAEKEVDIEVEIALQYTTEIGGNVYTFCNNISTGDGGTHEIGFRNAILYCLKSYEEEFIKQKDKVEPFTIDDVLEGLYAIVSVKHPDPQYEGQTKGKLGNSEVRTAVYQVLNRNFARFLKENKKIAELIIEKNAQARKARIAARKAKENVRNSAKISTLAGKLSNCSSRNPEECELFIVEGNSAGGSAKDGRDARTQAILPLRGKILNTAKANDQRIFANNEIGNMIQAIGAGFAETFDINKIRYHKIIIMTDADVDGSHIRILLLTFFFKYMRELIRNGNIYVAKPPLYCITYQKKKYYAYSDDELETLKKQLGLKGNYPFQRYKGLGEMDPSQLNETTMDANNRKLIRIRLEDAIEADKIFQDLMGNDVDPRKEFIIKNAKFVKNLDI